jgi:hypothetical protein
MNSNLMQFHHFHKSSFAFRIEINIQPILYFLLHVFVTPFLLLQNSQSLFTIEEPKKVSKDIWDAEDVPVNGFGAESDPRKRPEYEILYKQAVSTEDMYIGLSGRDPSSGSCEDLLVRI